MYDLSGRFEESYTDKRCKNCRIMRFILRLCDIPSDLKNALTAIQVITSGMN